jgi:predicted transcriptional regulator
LSILDRSKRIDPVRDRVAQFPPIGRLVADADGAHVQCHICGTWWAKLATHVRRRHGMSPDEYREEFGLNKSTGLVSPALR